MTKVDKEINEVYSKLLRIAPNNNAGLADAVALRRAAMTLHRWYEHECNGTIQRDEEDGKPYWYSEMTGKRIGPANDRERGAEKTIKRICERLGLHYYLQTDPRGGTLYVDSKPIHDNNYSLATFIA